MAWKFTLNTDSEEDVQEKKIALFKALKKEGYFVDYEKTSLSELLGFLIWNSLQEIGFDKKITSVDVKIAVPVQLNQVDGVWLCSGGEVKETR